MVVALLVAFLALLAVLGVVVWVSFRAMTGTLERQAELLTQLTRPADPIPPPSSQADPPSLPLRGVVAVDPTDGIIPDVDPSVGSTSLADAYPNVDPWLIGEVEYPESIAEVEFPADDLTQIMLPDGTWAKLEDAQLGPHHKDVL